MIAGNFGTGVSDFSHDVASLVPGHNGATEVNRHGSTSADIESAPDSPYGPNGDATMSLDTPFFHFDLLGAVNAAERGLARSESRSSAAESTGKEGL